MRIITLFATASLLVACNQESTAPESAVEAVAPAKEDKTATVSSTPESPKDNADLLVEILAEQSEEHKARQKYRNPAETMAFFGIEPGMTVVEYLPGGGWYTQILAPYLGSEGTIIGVDYSMKMWPQFSWATEEFITNRVNWGDEWAAKFSGWGGEEAAKPIGATVTTIADKTSDLADAALYIRALHNLSRFETEGQFLTEALAETFAVLKPGGIVGVVQHQAPEDKSDDWAAGSRGYLKKSTLIKQFENAGFIFEAESAINENELDQPGEEDSVWRLPPSLRGSKDDEAKKAAFTAIGESNRMTLLFRKPKA